MNKHSALFKLTKGRRSTIWSYFFNHNHQIKS